MSTTKFTVARRDPLSGRYGSAAGYKAATPAEAVIRAIQGPRRSTSLTVADVEHLGGERYRVGEQIYRVRVSS
jgi:hypothetical protein